MAGRPRKIENLFNAPKSNRQFSEGQKSKGILDDFPVREFIDLATGTVQHTPSADKDISNKEYSDSMSGFFNGSFVERFDALVTSDGSIVTLTVSPTSGSTLTSQFSDGRTDFTNPATITLSAGVDTAGQANYIYITKANKILEKSTTAWPSEEHNKIGYFLIPSAVFVQASGAYINQNWNDAMIGTDNEGHLLHIAEKLRRLSATYFSGIGGNGTDGYLTPSAGNVELKINTGVIYQLHEHATEAFDTSTGDEVLVKNWSGDAFHNITNLYDITADSTGATIGNNKYFNIVIWGVGNKTGEYHPTMINLPGGFYNTQTAAENDTSGFDDFTIPREFNRESSTGYLIAKITIQMITGGGTWVVAATKDLRGLTPSTATGGVDSSSFWEVSGTETQLIIPDAIDMQGEDILSGGTIIGTTISGANVTSGADPGHTHTGASLSSIDISSDTNLAVSGGNITLTGDELSVNLAAGVNVTGDHGTAATDELVNVAYGTGDPPTANTTTIGSLFVKYTA